MEIQKRITDITHNMVGWIWETDAQGNFTYVGVKAKEALGYDCDTLVGKNRREYLLPGEEKPFFQALEHLSAKGGKLSNYRGWYRNQKGQPTCLLTNCVPMTGPGKALIGFRGVDNDITREHRLETLLANTQQALKAIGHCSRFFLDPPSESSTHALLEQTCQALVHKAGYAMAWAGAFPLDPNEATWQKESQFKGLPSPVELAHTLMETPVPVMVQREFSQCRPPQDHTRAMGLPLSLPGETPGALILYSNQAYAFETEETRLLEELANTLSLGLSSLFLKRAKEKAQAQIQALNKNLEDRVIQRTRDLEKAKGLMDQLFNVTAEGLLYIDLDHTILNVNQTLLRQWKWKRQDVLGQKCFELFKNTICSHDRCGICDIRDSGRETISSEVDFKTEKGEHLFFMESCTALRGEDGQLSGVLKSLRNITQQKRMEQQLRRAKESAEAATRAKSRLLINMVQEIKDPMGQISQITHRLKENPQDRDRDLKSIATAASRLAHLVNGLTNFSEVESGELTIAAEPFEPALLFQRIQEILAGHPCQEEVAFSLDPRIPKVLVGDSHRLELILTHLVDNALKFAHHGDISLYACLGKKTGEKSEKKWTIRFGIRDTGKGMTPEQLSVLFQPFKPAGAPAPGTERGAGLGLSICQKLVHLMGGKIEVDSAPDQGSHFYFSLPFKSPSDNPQD